MTPAEHPTTETQLLAVDMPGRVSMPATPAQAFTAAAPAYDREFGAIPGVADLRRRVIAIVRRHVPEGGSVLELGAGTGEDALALTRSGYRVIATDVAPGMVTQAQDRLAGAAQVLLLDAAAAPASFPPGSFDAIFSNFGALNCVPELPRVLRDLVVLLRPGGVMVLCLLGRYPLREIVSGLLHGRPETAFRRMRRGPVHARVGSLAIPVWYPSVETIRRGVLPGVRLKEVEGLSVLSPPPRPDGANTGTDGMNPPPDGAGIGPARKARLIDRLDRKLGRCPGLNRLGDHVVLVLRSGENR